jgi:exodeoxyribonuclease-3
MKIMTNNILEGGIDDKGSRIEHIIAVINDVKPDFVALQEANNFDKNDNELLKTVSNETDLPHYALSPGAPRPGRKRYHVASLSRYPLREEHTFPESSFQSAALSVAIDTPLGEISLCNVHLHANSETERLKEIEVIIKYQSKHKNHIILGDFNAVSRSDDIPELSTEESAHYDLARFDVTDMLSESYVDAVSHLDVSDNSTHPTVGVSHPISKSQIRIDYVFVNPTLVSSIKKGAIIKTETSDIASDHYPVVVTLR